MQQATKRTTIHLNLPRRLDLPTPVSAAVCTFAIVAIAALVGRIQSTPAVKAPEPIILIATPAAPAAIAPATAIPQAVVFQQQPAQPSKMVVAFAAPSGDVLGPIPMPAASAILGRWGDSWIMVPWQGSNVWVRAADLGLNLANLAPAPQIAPVQAQPVYVAPAANYQVTNEAPPSPPEPTPAAAQPAVVAAPVNAPAAAPVQQSATETLQDAVDIIGRDVQQSGGQPSPAWRQEHCIGSGAAERCQ